MILFLDFDGVLHPTGQDGPVCATLKFCHLPALEALLRSVPDVRIVISSSWREQMPFTQLLAPFADDIRARVLGVTPALHWPPGVYHPARRERELVAWLAVHGGVDQPWVALDDTHWQFEQHKDRLVACVSWTRLDAQALHLLRARLIG